MILGEWDARQNPDCINGLCADPIVTIKIETMFTSYFNTKRKLHDILLIILERAVIFSGNDPMELTEEMEKSIGLCLFMAALPIYLFFQNIFYQFACPRDRRILVKWLKLVCFICDCFFTISWSSFQQFFVRLAGWGLTENNRVSKILKYTKV